MKLANYLVIRLEDGALPIDGGAVRLLKTEKDARAAVESFTNDLISVRHILGLPRFSYAFVGPGTDVQDNLTDIAGMRVRDFPVVEFPEKF